MPVSGAAANESLVSHVNSEITEILARIQPAIPAKSGPNKGFRALFSLFVPPRLAAPETPETPEGSR